MYAQSILWATIALEAILLARALQGRFYGRYLLFYIYLSYVFLRSIIGFYIYVARPDLYQNFYWSSQFFSVLLGYGVVWEIYRQALSRYPGAARMARNILLFILVIVLSKVFVSASNGPVWPPARSSAEFERNLRTIQSVLLVAVVLLLTYYAIPIGRNLKGMFLGYGFLVATSIINLTLRSHLGESFQRWWERLQPMAYLFVLLIWCGALWSSYPEPEPKTSPGIERHYQLLAAGTRRRLLHVRAYLTKAVRQ